MSSTPGSSSARKRGKGLSISELQRLVSTPTPTRTRVLANIQISDSSSSRASTPGPSTKQVSSVSTIRRKFFSRRKESSSEDSSDSSDSDDDHFVSMRARLKRQSQTKRSRLDSSHSHMQETGSGNPDPAVPTSTETEVIAIGYSQTAPDLDVNVDDKLMPIPLADVNAPNGEDFAKDEYRTGQLEFENQVEVMGVNEEEHASPSSVGQATHDYHNEQSNENETTSELRPVEFDSTVELAQDRRQAYLQMNGHSNARSEEDNSSSDDSPDLDVNVDDTLMPIPIADVNDPNSEDFTEDENRAGQLEFENQAEVIGINEEESASPSSVGQATHDYHNEQSNENETTSEFRSVESDSTVELAQDRRQAYLQMNGHSNARSEEDNSSSVYSPDLDVNVDDTLMPIPIADVNAPNGDDFANDENRAGQLEFENQAEVMGVNEEESASQSPVGQATHDYNNEQSNENATTSELQSMESDSTVEVAQDRRQAYLQMNGHSNARSEEDTSSSDEDDGKTCSSSESSSGTSGSATDEEEEPLPDNPVRKTVVAFCDADLRSYKRLQNSEMCGTNMSVDIKAVPSRVIKYKREATFWNMHYPGCYSSQSITKGTRFGFWEIDPRTIRPFELIGSEQPMFCWILKGTVILKSNVMELQSVDGGPVPVLSAHTFGKGELMIIPGDVPYSLENHTDDYVRIGYSIAAASP